MTRTKSQIRYVRWFCGGSRNPLKSLVRRSVRRFLRRFAAVPVSDCNSMCGGSAAVCGGVPPHTPPTRVRVREGRAAMRVRDKNEVTAGGHRCVGGAVHGTTKGRVPGFRSLGPGRAYNLHPLAAAAHRSAGGIIRAGRELTTAHPHRHRAAPDAARCLVVETPPGRRARYGRNRVRHPLSSLRPCAPRGLGFVHTAPGD